MRAMFSFVALLVVLAVVAVTLRKQLQASAPPVPAAASGPAEGASAPFGGSSSPTEAQFRQELDKTMRDAADRAASAGAAADADAAR